MAVGLGANLGRPVAAFRTALTTLSRVLTGLRVSSIYRTSPVGGPPQPEYRNAVTTGWTRLSPEELLSVCQRLEIAAGRARGRSRNTPRPLDLDILLYGARRVARKDLTLPHPRLTKRLFVLVPLAELVPSRIVPGTGHRVATLLAEARRTSTETVRPFAPPLALAARQRQA